MKTWEKPKLVVLVRSKPEEAILTTCKLQPGMTGQAGVPLAQQAGCVNLKDECYWSCSNLGQS